jgi:two-component system, NtrC family, response regulator HydG
MNAPLRLTAAQPPAREDAEGPVRVLVVDDEPGIRRALQRILSGPGFSVTVAEDGEAGLALVLSGAPDVALVDIRMPKLDGLELLTRVKEKGSQTEVIMMTGHGTVEEAVAAVKLGAYHFLKKPFENEVVAITVAQAAEHKRLSMRTRRLEQRLEAQERFGELLGSSPSMMEVYRLIEGVATATSTVLITGESGTGKELVARAIHQTSARAGKAFVPVNCAAIPKDLVESELFGHVRGAFTGAQSARVGLFESAHLGTIFLDEVGDLPLAAQVKLLRTLQEGEVKRVGSDETRIVDVRVLAATNVDLKSCIDQGTFRRDLYYRLNVIGVALPPLRERGDDITLLAYHFIEKYARRLGRNDKPIGRGALAALLQYAWPGNVRELEHAMERAVVLARGPEIDVRDLPSEIWPEGTSPSFIPTSRTASRAGAADPPTTDSPPAAPVEVPAPGELPLELTELPFAEAKRLATAQFEEAYLAHVLRRAGGNLSEAARRAGVDRSNFKRILRKSKV